MLMPEPDVPSGLQVAGLLAIGAGIGFLISAVVTQKLSKVGRRAGPHRNANRMALFHNGQ
jgi:hypothetical protein